MFFGIEFFVPVAIEPSYHLNRTGLVDRLDSHFTPQPSVEGKPHGHLFGRQDSIAVLVVLSRLGRPAAFLDLVRLQLPVSVFVVPAEEFTNVVDIELCDVVLVATLSCPDGDFHVRQLTVLVEIKFADLVFPGQSSLLELVDEAVLVGVVNRHQLRCILQIGLNEDE